MNINITQGLNITYCKMIIIGDDLFGEIKNLPKLVVTK